MKIAFSLAAASLIALLTTAGADAQVKGKDTVAKERRAGTTGDAGNRCPGGTYNTCVQANLKVGYSNRRASDHCTRTCAK